MKDKGCEAYNTVIDYFDKYGAEGGAVTQCLVQYWIFLGGKAVTGSTGSTKMVGSGGGVDLEGVMEEEREVNVEEKRVGE